VKGETMPRNPVCGVILNEKHLNLRSSMKEKRIISVVSNARRNSKGIEGNL
jgi:hypothetical protein